MPFGVVTEKVLIIRNGSFAITLLLGIVFQTALLTFAAFFFRLNVEVFTVNILLALLLGIWFQKEIKTKLKILISDFDSWRPFFKVVFFIIVALALAKSSLLPFIIDNESYYLQTIKWLNQYGFVNGLGNLHIYLAQGSPWHVLQAGLNFSFITDVINDINGFVFIVCSFYYLNEYYKQNQQTWIVYLLVFNVLLFQFLDSPSPDLPILVLLPILFYWFLEQKNSRMAILFFVFLLFIKFTMAPLVLLLLFWKMDKKSWWHLTFIGLFFGGLWLIKNSILSGYPFYPYPYFSLSVDWLVPENIRLFVIHITENSGYFVGNPTRSASICDKLISWLLLGGITGFFNKGMLLLFVIFPFTASFRSRKRYKTLYFIMLVHFVLLLFTSPQFRFFLPEILFFGAVIINEMIVFIDKKNQIGKLIIFSGVVLPIVFMFPISLNELTSNINHQTTDSFEMKQLLYPKPSSKFYYWKFEKKQRGNLIYYSPVEKQFFNTGDGDLPCLADPFLDYMEGKYKIVPQQRTSEIKDGFYSKSTL